MTAATAEPEQSAAKARLAASTVPAGAGLLDLLELTSTKVSEVRKQPTNSWVQPCHAGMHPGSSGGPVFTAARDAPQPVGLTGTMLGCPEGAADSARRYLFGYVSIRLLFHHIAQVDLAENILQSLGIRGSLSEAQQDVAQAKAALQQLVEPLEDNEEITLPYSGMSVASTADAEMLH